MRALQPRAWLSGVGKAHRAPWMTESLQLITNSSCQNYAEAELQTDDTAGRDADFLRLLSQSYMPATSEHSPPSTRPLLATLPAAAELMENAVSKDASPQPVYDLPTFLNSAYPHAGVSPRNPSYDWRAWSRSHLSVVPAAAAAGGSVSPTRTTVSPGLQEKLGVGEEVQDFGTAARTALLMEQVDRHMQNQESRRAIVRLAKLELAHLWYYQQQQQQQRQRWHQHHHQNHQQSAETGAASSSSAAAAAAAGGDDRTTTEHDHPGGSAGASASASPSSSSSSRPVAGLREEGSRGAAAASAAGAAAARDEGRGQEGGGGGEVDEDDIFAAAERRVEARRQALVELREMELEQRAARDPLSLLPPNVQLRLREVQRRADPRGASSGTGRLDDVLKHLGQSFQDSKVRVVQRRADAEEEVVGANAAVAEGGGSSSTQQNLDRLAQRLSKMDEAAAEVKEPAEVAFFSRSRDASSSPSSSSSTSTSTTSSSASSSSKLTYWDEHPVLSYIDNAIALAHRESQAHRRVAAGGPDGHAAAAAAVAALSAALPRGVPASPASASSSSSARLGLAAAAAAATEPPATPMLSLLLDYLQLKYQDLLHTWEVQARLQEATEHAAARDTATVEVQAGPLLPPELLSELKVSWDAAAASFRPESLGLGLGGDLAAAQPLSWQQAYELLLGGGGGLRAVGSSSGGGGASAASGDDLRSAVQRALAPLLNAAAERHRALLGGGNGGDGGSAAAAATATAAAAAAATAAPPAASVACFRETLILDASSGFEGGSHDPRVSLEFDLGRLAAAEPALGGAWGRRFLERLLSAPMWPHQAPTRGSRAAADAWRQSQAAARRRGPAARSAAMAAAFPPDVEYSFSRRTGTATLTTSRYRSREANRRLLLEHYAALLKAAAAAAATAAGGAAGGAAPAASSP